MSHSLLTHDRSILMLEGLWDQLESAASAMRTSDEQPAAIAVVQSRVSVYRIRLREVIAKVHRDARGSETDAQLMLTRAMLEVVELLDAMPSEPPHSWIATIYRAQDAVLAALHDMRSVTRTRVVPPFTAIA